jgi:hypothetical protein
MKARTRPPGLPESRVFVRLDSAGPPVAQWIRATDFGSVGRGFESLRAGHEFEEQECLRSHPVGPSGSRRTHAITHKRPRDGHLLAGDDVCAVPLHGSPGR